MFWGDGEGNAAGGLKGAVGSAWVKLTGATEDANDLDGDVGVVSGGAADGCDVVGERAGTGAADSASNCAGTEEEVAEAPAATKLATCGA